jgi:hypothetical protein
MIELWWQYFCTLHSTKCETLNPKQYELHLDLTLIPNQSYAKMHRLCVRYAYAYSYYAYPDISIHECLDVHIGMGNSCPNMDEHRLLHDCFMPDMYKDEYLEKNQISNTTTCISGYYPGSYSEFSIYPGNTGLYLISVDSLFLFFLQVVSTCVLFCLVLLLDGFSSLIFMYKVFLRVKAEIWIWAGHMCCIIIISLSLSHTHTHRVKLCLGFELG